MQEIQGNMDDVLSGNNLRDDEKDKRYFQLQNRYLAKIKSSQLHFLCVCFVYISEFKRLNCNRKYKPFLVLLGDRFSCSYFCNRPFQQTGLKLLTGQF